MKNQKNLLDQDRFTQPQGWVWGGFQRAGRTIRYGYVMPKKPRGIVVCLPGLGEYAEKYFETARDINAQNLGFVVIDWMGQGASDRYLPNALKRHADDFNEDILDLHYLVTNCLSDFDVPLIMLGHSMGGNIGLRTLAAYPGMFMCAAFTAPMCGIKDIAYLPLWFQMGLSSSLNLMMGKSFTSGHGGAALQQREYFDHNILSNDPERFALHGAWFNEKPALRIGDVTFGWVYHAIQSCAALGAKAHNITTPTLIALAEDEKIIDNTSARHIAAMAKNCRLHIIKHAKHEILMEKDTPRQEFLDCFFAMIKEYIE